MGVRGTGMPASLRAVIARLAAPPVRGAGARRPAELLRAHVVRVPRDHGSQGSGIPCPRTHCLCEDESVIGRAFYIMEYVEGRVLWDPSLPDMTPPERAAIYDEMNRVIAALHRIDYAAAGLATSEKPGNYFARQIGRWSRQYRALETEANRVHGRSDRLASGKPFRPGDETTVGARRLPHGQPDLPSARAEILAVLDLGAFHARSSARGFFLSLHSWHISAGASFAGVRGSTSPRSAFRASRKYRESYWRAHPAGRSSIGISISPTISSGIAAILQGVMKRALEGTAASAQALEAAGAPVRWRNWAGNTPRRR